MSELLLGPMVLLRNIPAGLPVRFTPHLRTSRLLAPLIPLTLPLMSGTAPAPSAVTPAPTPPHPAAADPAPARDLALIFRLSLTVVSMFNTPSSRRPPRPVAHGLIPPTSPVPRTSLTSTFRNPSLSVPTAVSLPTCPPFPPNGQPNATTVSLMSPPPSVCNPPGLLPPWVFGDPTLRHCG